MRTFRTLAAVTGLIAAMGAVWLLGGAGVWMPH